MQLLSSTFVARPSIDSIHTDRPSGNAAYQASNVVDALQGMIQS